MSYSNYPLYTDYFDTTKLADFIVKTSKKLIWITRNVLQASARIIVKILLYEDLFSETSYLQIEPSILIPKFLCL